MSNTTYKVTPKTVYGNKLYYPACPLAQLFCDLTHSKTITVDTMQRLYKDGYYPVGDLGGGSGKTFALLDMVEDLRLLCRSCR